MRTENINYNLENNYFDFFYNTDNIPLQRNRILINERTTDIEAHKLFIQSKYQILSKGIQKKKYGKLVVNFFNKLIKNNLIKFSQMNIYTIKKIYKTYFANFKSEQLVRIKLLILQ